MITGSHNPPDYNGFKILIGGVTQAGDRITDMYNRIQSGNLRVGKGTISKEDMLDRYRERISGDIQLQKPLRIVADCGNGIGGVCAADVLRAIGAEVIPLFDEVDGTFPNHHPDPSEPENLKDLIDAVHMMNADVGVAFDGDADRLGVVTADGEIIYSDRLMMLFVQDILGRVPGSTIIYDVKCTGHLHDVIEEAGGTPMMYKTGHSLIKNKMKEVGAPFAGEMSGHFFFKERWYGFDCGIYAAARLLEILAADEREVQEVLSSLPNSFSTPELKVEMHEGENHDFVAEFQRVARFADAKITTIDGLRADFADGWGLVRASNTTPILVIRFDADSEAALQRIKDAFKQQLLAIYDQLKLPF
jgi:phosphomannomutase/phosphoglucomutase